MENIHNQQKKIDGFRFNCLQVNTQEISKKCSFKKNAFKDKLMDGAD